MMVSVTYQPQGGETLDLFVDTDTLSPFDHKDRWCDFMHALISALTGPKVFTELNGTYYKDSLLIFLQEAVPYTDQAIAAQRLKEHTDVGIKPIILHFGDHDPSSIDMSRDIKDRLELFLGHELQVERLALTMDQIHEHEPPPNPAKTTDGRFAKYEALYGSESWELDALSPAVLASLVVEAAEQYIDPEVWAQQKVKQEDGRHKLKTVSTQWEKLTAKL